MRKIDTRYKIIGGSHRALSRYYMIANRIKNCHYQKNSSYKNVRLLVKKEDFVKWFMERDFEGCSVDRINNNGHYELTNMHIITLAENIRKDKIRANNGMCVCYSCKESKPLIMFAKDSRRKLGVSTLCRKCDSARFKNVSPESHEKRKKAKRDYYHKNKNLKRNSSNQLII